MLSLFRLVALSPLIVFPPALPLGHLTRDAFVGYSTSTTSHGLELTFVLPHLTYPANALVPVRVILGNPTGHHIEVAGGCRANPIVEGVEDDGTVSYPPDIFPNFTILCPPSPPGRPYRRYLEPKHAIVLTTYTVARTAHLRGAAYITSVPLEMDTPPLTLTLTAGTAPTAVLNSSGPRPSIVVTRPTGAQGPLLYESWARCGRVDGIGYELGIVPEWEPVHGNRIDTLCEYGSPTLEWHVLAGWPGYPIASVNLNDMRRRGS